MSIFLIQKNRYLSNMSTQLRCWNCPSWCCRWQGRQVAWGSPWALREGAQATAAPLHSDCPGTLVRRPWLRRQPWLWIVWGPPFCRYGWRQLYLGPLSRLPRYGHHCCHPQGLFLSGGTQECPQKRIPVRYRIVNDPRSIIFIGTKTKNTVDCQVITHLRLVLIPHESLLVWLRGA